jgi:hypothetical protein
VASFGFAREAQVFESETMSEAGCVTSLASCQALRIAAQQRAAQRAREYRRRWRHAGLAKAAGCAKLTMTARRQGIEWFQE